MPLLTTGHWPLATRNEKQRLRKTHMQLLESVRTSLEEVKGHPLRSFFTLIGVILGTLAIVVVMSVLDGVGRAVWSGMEDLGMDGVLVMSQRKPTDAMERAKAHLSHGL